MSDTSKSGQAGGYKETDLESNRNLSPAASPVTQADLARLSETVANLGDLVRATADRVATLEKRPAPQLTATTDLPTPPKLNPDHQGVVNYIHDVLRALGHRNVPKTSPPDGGDEK